MKIGDRCKQVIGSRIWGRVVNSTKFLFTITCLLSPTRQLQAVNPGITIMPVLLETRSVRSIALGKTFVSDSKNASSVFEGSSGLYFIDSPQISFFYNRSFADVGFGYFAFAYPLKNFTVGIGVLNMQTDTFDTVIKIDNVQTGETSIERSFIKGQNDWVYTIGAGIKLTKWFISGLNIKYYNSTLIEKHTASGYAFDLSVRFPISNFEFGFSYNNISSKVAYLKEKFNLPEYLQVGLSYNTKKEKFYHNFNIVLEYQIRRYEEINFLHSGIEWSLPLSWIRPLDDVYLRAGHIIDLPKNRNQRLTAGVGLVIASILIDYSFIPHSKLGMSHYFSITYRFPVVPAESDEM